MTPAEYAALVTPLRPDAAPAFLVQAEEDQNEFLRFVTSLSVEQFATFQGCLRSWVTILSDGHAGTDQVVFPLDEDESVTHHLAWLVTAE